MCHDKEDILDTCISMRKPQLFSTVVEKNTFKSSYILIQNVPEVEDQTKWWDRGDHFQSK